MSSENTDTQTQEASFAEAAKFLREGGVVVFPTETVYGVGAAVNQAEGMKRLRELKSRTDGKPFSVHLSSAEAVEQFVDLNKNFKLKKLVQRCMPGPITIITRVDEETFKAKQAELGLTDKEMGELYFNGTIGLRVPSHPASMAILAQVGAPVVASSANYAGEPAPITAEAASSIAADVDAVIDGDKCRYAGASTIIDISGDEPRIIREGLYDEPYLTRIMKMNIMFVCTGNTCRSPMAAGIAKDIIKNQGLEAEVEIASAGVFATGGMAATPEALEVLESMGIDHSDHLSQPMSREMLDNADLVLCMTASHRDALLQMNPNAVEKVHLLDPAGIDDPIGGTFEIYQACAAQIKKGIEAHFAEQKLV